MATDPLFIIGILGMALCLFGWIKFNLNKSDVEPFIMRYLSSISFISGLALLLSIFYNSGDLGIVLLAGSIIAFIVMVFGYYVNNNEIKITARGYFIPIVLIFVLRTFLYEPYQIPSGSMEPQLKKGDFLLVNKFAYGLKVNRIGIPNFLRKDPQYGDTVVLIPPHNPVPYIKRLVGKPGDTVKIINKRLYINGIALERNFINTEDYSYERRVRYQSTGEIKTNIIDAVGDLYSEKNGDAEYIIRNTRGLNTQYPQEWKVPEGHYFVMGDNRDNSNDSTKDVGFVPRENFFGRADYLWMTWACWGCLPSFEKAGKIK
jgi:signal peptidase I|tara:strand:+ start:3340 stop:4290 length:951 start_codon:yes stop_codon:yes gene_type:complete